MPDGIEKKDKAHTQNRAFGPGFATTAQIFIFVACATIISED
ncbi:hypothetical protein V5T82_07990 [Magnetovibrio sp. PR-2]